MMKNVKQNNKIILKALPRYFTMVELNNLQNECEVSLFPETAVSYQDIEKLAKGLYSYYEYLGFNGNPNGVSLSENLSDERNDLTGLSFKILTAKNPIYLSAKNFYPINEEELINEIRSNLPKIGEKEIPQINAKFYENLNDFFFKNPIETTHTPSFQERLHFNNETLLNMKFSSSMPIFDLFNEETYLIQAQGSNNNKNIKYEFGSAIVTNEEDARNLAASISAYYQVNGIPAGVIVQQIPNDTAFDMVVGKNMNDFNLYYNYYHNAEEFLSNGDGWDFKYLRNGDLKELGYYGDKVNKQNRENPSQTYFTPLITSGEGKTSRLVSYTDKKEAETYLTAFLSTLKSAEKVKSKIDKIEIFGDAKGMDLHSNLQGNITFSSIISYINFVESSKRHTPLDVPLATYNKIVEYLINNNLIKS